MAAPVSDRSTLVITTDLSGEVVVEGAAVPGESELHPEVSSSTVTKRLDTDGLTSQPYRGRSWCPPNTELPIGVERGGMEC